MTKPWHAGHLHLEFVRGFKTVIVDALTAHQEQMKQTILKEFTNGEFARRIALELNKHTRANTPSRERTSSARRRAGSRKGNGRQRIASDFNRPVTVLRMVNWPQR